MADLILLGNPSEIMDLAREWGLGNISRATIIDPENRPKQEEYAQLLCQLRQKKRHDNLKKHVNWYATLFIWVV